MRSPLSLLIFWAHLLPCWLPCQIVVGEYPLVVSLIDAEDGGLAAPTGPNVPLHDVVAMLVLPPH